MRWLLNLLTILGPVNTYQDIFENGYFFSQFSQQQKLQYASTHSVFESLSRILMKTLKESGKEYHQSYHQYHPL